MRHQYGYDLDGNRTQVIYGGINRTITSVYDALNRHLSMTDSGRVTSYSYDLNSNIITKTSANGDVETSIYDALNRETNLLTNNSAGALEYQDITGYDLMGNVLSTQEIYPSSTVPTRTVTNTYDAIYRLMSESSAVTGGLTTLTAYSYDAANNRSTQEVTIGSGSTATTTYSYNSLNQVTGTTGAIVSSFGYDVDGNRTSQTVNSVATSYSYDAENRLINVIQAAGGSGPGTYNYVYDYRTRRIVRDESAASGVLTQLVYSGGNSVQEYTTSDSSPSNLQVEYIRGSDYGGGVGGILYSLRAGLPSYTHSNKRGDITAKSDSSGSLTYVAQYQAFGDQVATYGSTLDRQKSNSKEQDLWGGHNEGMRYRDDFGFLTRDPAGMIDGPNEYTYVRQNPWTKFDPEGLCVKKVLQTIEHFFNGTLGKHKNDEKPEGSDKSTKLTNEQVPLTEGHGVSRFDDDGSGKNYSGGNDHGKVASAGVDANGHYVPEDSPEKVREVDADKDRYGVAPRDLAPVNHPELKGLPTVNIGDTEVMTYHFPDHDVTSTTEVADYGPNRANRRYGESSVAQNASVGLNIHHFDQSVNSKGKVIPAHYGLSTNGKNEPDIPVDVKYYPAKQ